MGSKAHSPISLSRRQVLGAAGAGLVAAATIGLAPGRAEAGLRDAMAKLAELTGVEKPEKDRVTVILPAITDQGPLVPITVMVASPMTEDDYVQAIHIVATRNTVPEVASFYLSPANGAAEISTRIRVKESQIIMAAAQMNDGTVYLGRERCRVVGGGGGCG